MKRLNLLLLVFGAAIIFFGCEKMDPIVPDAIDDQEITSLKSAIIKTPFNGNCTFLAELDPGTDTPLPNGMTLRTGIVSQWKDNSDDPLVAGVSTWTMNWMIEKDGISARMWGTAEIVLDEDRGKWELSFHGKINKTKVGMKIKDICFGEGIEGEVEGLTAKWQHEMDYDFSDPLTFIYYFNGFYH